MHAPVDRPARAGDPAQRGGRRRAARAPVAHQRDASRSDPARAPSAPASAPAPAARLPGSIGAMWRTCIRVATRQPSCGWRRALVHLLELGRLRPGRGHQRVLLLAHDAGAEAGDGAVLGREVQPLEPARRAGRRRPVRAPPAPRRRAAARAADPRRRATAAGAFRTGRQRRLPGGLQVPAAGQSRAGAFDGAAARRRGGTVVPAGSADVEAAFADVDGLDADALGQRAGGQQHGERLEVAAGAGRELPGVVDRQLGLGLARLPRRRQLPLVVCGDLQPEPRLAAELEGRHDAGDVLASRAAGRAREQPRRPTARGSPASWAPRSPRRAGARSAAHAPRPSCRRGRAARPRRLPAGRSAAPAAASAAAGRAARRPAPRTTTRHSQGLSRACAPAAAGVKSQGRLGSSNSISGK